MRMHDTIDKVVQRKYALLPYTGTLKRVDISGWISKSKWQMYFHNSLGMKWHMQTTEIQIRAVNKRSNYRMQGHFRLSRCTMDFDTDWQ